MPVAAKAVNGGSAVAAAGPKRRPRVRGRVERLWFITNPHSGSTSAAKCDAVEAVFAEQGLTLVGRTHFPDDELPAPAALDRERVDTVVLFAGDGTINAAVCALAIWDGAVLILPGGTMNLLAKALHGDAQPHAIIHAAHRGGRQVALPFVEAGPHRAFVGLILGPAAHWVRAREAARKGRVKALAAAARNAWRRTFSRGIRLTGAAALHKSYQAVFVAASDGALRVGAIDARDLRSIIELGWDWLTGAWVAARAVDTARVERLGIAGDRPVMALFDGEPVMLEADVTITAGETKPRYLSTKDAA